MPVCPFKTKTGVTRGVTRPESFYDSYLDKGVPWMVRIMVPQHGRWMAERQRREAQKRL